MEVGVKGKMNAATVHDIVEDICLARDASDLERESPPPVDSIIWVPAEV